MRSSGFSKQICFLKIAMIWEFPGDPVVGTLCFHCRGHGFDPWSVPHDRQRGQKKKTPKKPTTKKDKKIAMLWWVTFVNKILQNASSKKFRIIKTASCWIEVACINVEYITFCNYAFNGCLPLWAKCLVRAGISVLSSQRCIPSV